MKPLFYHPCRPSGLASASSFFALLKLFYQAVHLRNVHARAFGNAVLSRNIENRRIAALLLCHGKNDGFCALHGFSSIMLSMSFILPPTPGSIPRRLPNASHFVHLLHTGEIIVEVKIHLFELLLHLLACFLSTEASTFSMRLMTSPIPKIREAIRSG